MNKSKLTTPANKTSVSETTSEPSKNQSISQNSTQPEKLAIPQKQEPTKNSSSLSTTPPTNSSLTEAPTNLTSIPQKQVKSQAPPTPVNDTESKFMGEFTDNYVEDLEEDDDDTDKKGQMLQVGSSAAKNVSEEDMKKLIELNYRVRKITNNVKLAQAALDKHRQHTNELRESLKAAKGVARKEFKKLLSSSDKHVQEIEQYVAEG